MFIFHIPGCKLFIIYLFFFLLTYLFYTRTLNNIHYNVVYTYSLQV